MATTPAFLTMEEYLKTSYRPNCDFVDPRERVGYIVTCISAALCFQS